MVQISMQNSGWKVVFSGGSMEPPLGTNGSKSTMVNCQYEISYNVNGKFLAAKQTRHVCVIAMTRTLPAYVVTPNDSVVT